MSSLSFGRYDPLFRIAAGGMAEVYAARIQGEAGFQKLVAVKRMLPHLADDSDFVAMFLDEGRLAANIASPHVVSTLDLGRAEDGALYIVMELVIGTALSALLKASAKAGRPVPVDIACEIMAQAAMGLDDAHEARTPTGVHLGIVHRDVSPQNVLVGVDGRTRVVDFGVARAVLRQSHTSTGTLKGKFAYFSPEQAAARELDRRSDVFALGIVAWETLLSRRLFEADNPLEQITRVRSLPIPRPTELRPDIPEAVSDVVMKALERDPTRRWESAGAFASALRRALPTTASAKEIAAFVDEIVGKSIKQMQSRIEAALAGEDLVTHRALRTPARGVEEPGTQATPSLPAAGHVVDLPTLLRPLPPDPPTAPLAAPSGITQAPSTTPTSGTGRIWIAAIAGVAVLALVAVAALATRAPEPVASPLPGLAATPPPTTSVTAQITPLPPPTEVAPTPATPDRPTREPVRPIAVARPQEGTPPPTTVAAVATPPLAPTTTTTVTTTTPVTTTPPPPSEAARPAPTTTVAVRPPDPPPTTTVAERPRERETTRTPPAGLAGDDAFDQGI